MECLDYRFSLRLLLNIVEMIPFSNKASALLLRILFIFPVILTNLLLHVFLLFNSSMVQGLP